MVNTNTPKYAANGLAQVKLSAATRPVLSSRGDHGGGNVHWIETGIHSRAGVSLTQTAAMKFEKVLRISSAVCQIIAIVTMVTGFASPYWIESQSFRETGFERMGLWEACFKNYVFPGDYLGQRHNGCFWIFHITYRNVWRTLNPGEERDMPAVLPVRLVGGFP